MHLSLYTSRKKNKILTFFTFKHVSFFIFLLLLKYKEFEYETLHICVVLLFNFPRFFPKIS